MKFFVYRDFAALSRSLPLACPINVRKALLGSVRAGTISDIDAASTAQAIATASQHPVSPQVSK